MLKASYSGVCPTRLPTPSETGAISLEELAESRLRRNGSLGGHRLVCQESGGVLTLSGCLPSYYLKQIAQTVVADLEGLERIVNEIDVAAPLPRSSRWN